MTRQLCVPMLCFALAVLICVGCGNNKPDLVPANPTGMALFCNIDDQGNLKVYVENQGTAQAAGSELEVRFDMGSGTFTAARGATGPIAPGSTDDVMIGIPTGCFNPDCDFTITVDVVNTVQESNEGNNNADGRCIG